MGINTVDDAERILRGFDCSIKTFLAEGHTQYVVRYGYRNVSPSFDTITSLCQWVIASTEAIRLFIKNVEEHKDGDRYC